MASTGVSNERYCTVLLPPAQVTGEGGKAGLPPTQDDILKGLESPKVELKVRAVKMAILGLLHGDKYPKVLMHIIRFCSTQSDHTLKKLLMVYWEIAPKFEPTPANAPALAPKLLPEMILVCNALLNDLNHPNEYIRGCMLRFLCKIKEREILEPLTEAVKQNLEHRHAYVRKNAVMTVYTMYKTFGDALLPDAPTLIEKLLLNETDAGARRNAFLMLFDCAQDRAVAFLMNAIELVPKYGDGFSLVILEMTRKVCRQDPSQKARFVRLIFQLLNASSPAVSYEAAWTLVTLSSAPTAVRAAAKTYCGLLNAQSDNNVKLIVLDRLADLKKHHTKVLQEVLMDMLRALNSPSLDICKKVLEIAMDLVSTRNIDEVVTQLKREVVKTQDKAHGDKSGEYRHLLIRAIHACAVKFPEVATHVVHLLMEFLNTDGAMDVILFVRAMCESYPELRERILQKLLVALPEISQGKVYRVALWILGEYAADVDTDGSGTSISEAVQAILGALGPLPLGVQAVVASNNPEDGADADGVAYSTPVSKSVVLADGTYATETAYASSEQEKKAAAAAAAALNDDANTSGLRKLILSGDFFVGTAVASTLTKLCVRAATAVSPAAAKPLILESTRAMCAIISYGQPAPGAVVKHEIDGDSARRILMGVRILLDPSCMADTASIITEECRASYRQLLDNQLAQQAEQNGALLEEPLSQADDLISFRQLRGKKALGSTDIDIDDGADISRAQGQQHLDGSSNEYSGKLRHVHQLTGFADPVYAEAYVTVHDYDIVLEILVINRLPQTLTNLSVDLSTIGDLKMVERPLPQTIGPLDQRTIRANIKVASTETGHIFGTIVYDSASGAEKTYVNLNDIHLDIMDYIHPASCTDAEFRAMWAEFEWENKVAVNTEITNVFEFLQHVVDRTSMRCLTPTASLGGDTHFLAANLYAKSVFGEDALVNLSVEKLVEKGKIAGYIRIRSKTQGIALSLGDRITAIQRGHDDQDKGKKAIA